MPGILYLEVNAGLCNRIRALVSGICWAESLGRKLVVSWPSHKPECMARFHELFSEDSLPSDVVISLIHKPLNTKVTCLSPVDAKKYIAQVPLDQPISIQSHGRFWDNTKNELWLENLRRLRPSTSILKLITAYKEQYGLIDSAFHIRRTDNQKAIWLSPLELFGLKIQEYLNRNQGGKALVFSDDLGAIESLKMSLGTDRLLCPEVLRERHSLNGMIEATAVFFTLASMKRIYGSTNSSFSEIARDYGNNTLYIVLG